MGVEGEGRMKAFRPDGLTQLMDAESGLGNDKVVGRVRSR